MKKFLVLTLKSGFGTAVAIALYVVTTGLMVYGSVDPEKVVVTSLTGGAVFGAIFALVHRRRRCRPSPGSSLTTGTACVAGVVLISIYAGTFAGFSLGVITALIASALLTSTGMYLGSRIGRQRY